MGRGLTERPLSAKRPLERPILGDLFEYVVRDEISHVAFGNKWVRYITKTPEELARTHQAALARRSAFGSSFEGPLIFPLTSPHASMPGLKAPPSKTSNAVTRPSAPAFASGCAAPVGSLGV
jgi:hypothetical protein